MFYMLAATTLDNRDRRKRFNITRLQRVAVSDMLTVPTLPQGALCFLLGAPRSGTTLLSTCLSLNDALFVPEELHVGYTARFQDKIAYAQESAYFRALTTGLYHALELLCGEKDAQYVWYQMWSQDLRLEDQYSYLYHRAAHRILVDKTPRLLYLGQGEQPVLDLMKYEPRFIFLYRHPLSAIRSATMFYRPLLKSVTDMTSSPIINPVNYEEARRFASNPADYSEYVWRSHNRANLSFIKQVPKDRVVWICYEDLVRYPDTQLRKICATLDIPYDPGMTRIETVRKGYSHWGIIKAMWRGKLPVGDPNMLWATDLRSINAGRADAYKAIEHRWEELRPDTRALAYELGYVGPTR